LVTVIEERLHVLSVKFFLVLYLELRADVSQVVIDPILLRSAIDSIQIADTLAVNK
jgi:hypothetical protein